MIVAIGLQEDTGSPPATIRVPWAAASVRRHMPNAHIVHVTNESFPGGEWADEVFRFPRAGLDFVEWGFSASAALCERDEGVFGMGTDVIVLRDVSDVFDRAFDFAACRYPARTRTDRAFCGDANFFRGPLAIRVALAEYRALPAEQRDGWEGGQTAFMRAAPRLRAEELDFDTYCWTPEAPEEWPPASARIAHFRGPRKAWMRWLAEREGLL